MLKRNNDQPSLAWTNDELRAWMTAELDKAFPRAAAFELRRPDCAAAASETSWEWSAQNIEMLRLLHPTLAPCLNLPGIKTNKAGLSRKTRIRHAVNEAQYIRALLKQYGLKKFPDGRITPEQIAAERNGLTEDDVKKRR